MSQTKLNIYTDSIRFDSIRFDSIRFDSIFTCFVLHRSELNDESKMSHMCKRFNCGGAGTSHCSVCRNEWYCSVECQRADWKDHKITCGQKLLSEQEIDIFIIRAMERASNLQRVEGKGGKIGFYKETIAFAEYQFGDRVPNESFRRRKDGVTYEKDWLLFGLRELLTETYIDLATVTSLDAALAYAKETRALLEMRRGNSKYRVAIYDLLYKVNTQLGDIFRKTVQYENSLYHMKEALVAARHGGNENNGAPSQYLIPALNNAANINNLLKNEDAIHFAEEAYNLASGQHGPEHYHTQDSATFLIDIYLRLGNFVDAERFARINYECLIDPKNNVDQTSKLFALGKLQVARVWSFTPSLERIGGYAAAEEAETLLKETIKILENMGRDGLDESTTQCLLASYHHLGDVMMKRGKADSEVKSILLKALSMTKECSVGIVPRIESSLHRYNLLMLLAELYLILMLEDKYEFVDNGMIILSLRAYEETVKIAKALFNSDDERLHLSRRKVEQVKELLPAL